MPIIGTPTCAQIMGNLNYRFDYGFPTELTGRSLSKPSIIDSDYQVADYLSTLQSVPSPPWGEG